MTPIDLAPPPSLTPGVGEGVQRAQLCRHTFTIDEK
jgi:hypothetical protein